MLSTPVTLGIKRAGLDVEDYEKMGVPEFILKITIASISVVTETCLSTHPPSTLSVRAETGKSEADMMRIEIKTAGKCLSISSPLR
jgi:hypothetical protein